MCLTIYLLTANERKVFDPCFLQFLLCSRKPEGIHFQTLSKREEVWRLQRTNTALINWLLMNNLMKNSKMDSQNMITFSIWQVGPIWDVILPHWVHDGPESVEGPGVEHVLKEVLTFTSSLSNQRHQVVSNITKDSTVSIHHLPKVQVCIYLKKNIFENGYLSL